MGLAVPDEVQPRDSTSPPALEPMLGKRSRLELCRRHHRREFLRPSRVPDGRSEEMLAGWWWYQPWSAAVFHGSPDGIRTRATALRGRNRANWRLLETLEKCR
jgi:hypothetical protein